MEIEAYRNQAHRDLIQLLAELAKCRELRNRLSIMKMTNGIDLEHMDKEMASLIKSSIDEVLDGDWSKITNAAIRIMDARIVRLGKEIVAEAENFVNVDPDRTRE